MSAISKIQWTDRTWNPVRGCSIVSPGCVNCYAMKQAHRFSAPQLRNGHYVSGPYVGLTKQTKAGPQWTGRIRTVEDALLEPLSWRKPQRIFVNSMSDLFHEGVPDEFIGQVLNTILFAGRERGHTFQVLTKRPARMLDCMRRYYAPGGLNGTGNPSLRQAGLGDVIPWLWLGVSAEDQQRADERIPLLMQTPAAVRFVSAEPLLGPIDLERVPLPDAWLTHYGITGCAQPLSEKDTEPDDWKYFTRKAFKLDWVIVGGESGAGARPCHEQWIRDIVTACREAQVACFVKQVGSIPIAVPYRGSYWEWKKEKFGDDWRVSLNDRKGGDPSEWPVGLSVREFPRSAVPA